MQRSRAILERLELVRLLKALGRYGYPPRPPPRQPDSLEPDTYPDDPAPEECSQIPEHWNGTGQLPLNW